MRPSTDCESILPMTVHGIGNESMPAKRAHLYDHRQVGESSFA